MTPEQHKAAHVKLHQALDTLIADMIDQVPHFRPSTSTVLELMRWSHKQTQNPTTREDPLPPQFQTIGAERLERYTKIEREMQGVIKALGEAGIMAQASGMGAEDGAESFATHVAEVNGKICEFLTDLRQQKGVILWALWLAASEIVEDINAMDEAWNKPAGSHEKPN